MEHYATAQQIWAAALVFARIGAMLMVLPGIGEANGAAEHPAFLRAGALALPRPHRPALSAAGARRGGRNGLLRRERGADRLTIGGLLRVFLSP